MGAGTALEHSLISLLSIYARNLGQDGISQNGNGMVANHTVIVLTPQIPDGQIAVGLLMENHIADKLSSHIGAKQCVEGMSSTEGVPEAEGTVVSLALGHLLDLEVGVHITAVNVAHGIGLHQHVVKTGIEDSLLGICTLDIYTCQLLFPSVMGRLGIIIEVPALGLGLHILARTIIIDGRDCHLYHKVLCILVAELEGSTQGASVHHIALAYGTASVHQQTICEGLAELGTEVDLTQLGPTRQHTEALDCMVVNHTHLALDNLIGTTAIVVGIATPCHTVEVQNHRLLPGILGEGITMNTCMNRSREVDQDALVLQLDHIEAGGC